jgi:acid stress-induced BolA-like protein IbaG/YrbA
MEKTLVSFLEPWLPQQQMLRSKGAKWRDIRMTPATVEAMIKAGIADATVQATDLTGGGDHYKAIVVSAQFAGKSLVQQHQLVYSAVKTAMASEEIHALSLETFTPEAWSANQSA